jgi:hypothetical protein
MAFQIVNYPGFSLENPASYSGRAVLESHHSSLFRSRKMFPPATARVIETIADPNNKSTIQIRLEIILTNHQSR